jgi:hypothetical protein
MDIQTEELNKSPLGDKLWRISHLYKIRNKNKQLTCLKPNNIQLGIYEAIKDKAVVRDYFLKYRQGGVSTWFLIWWLDETLTKRNTISGILSHTRESLKYLWDIIRIAYTNMPSVCMEPAGKFNETELSFPALNSKIFVSLGIRSTSVNNLHISEICYMEAKDIQASLATVPPGGNVSIESTANGLGNEGQILYQEAQQDLNGYAHHFFPWYIQDEYRLPLNGMTISLNKEEDKLRKEAKKLFHVELSDEQILWRRVTKKQQGFLYDQEFPEDDSKAFLSTGNPYFDNKKMLALLQEARSANKENQELEETYDYTAWEIPQKHDLYVAGVDVAEGIDGDWSVIKIINVTKRREAFRYRARVPIDKFYRECDYWGRQYNTCLLAIERNNHGHAVIQGLYETMRYPNLFVQDRDIRNVKIRGISEQKTIVKIGWETTALSKPLMLDQLKEGIEGNMYEDVAEFQPEIEIKDELFLQEALTIQQNNKTICAIQGKHDDIVIASAIAFQMYLRARKRVGKSPTEGILLGEPMESLQKFGII